MANTGTWNLASLWGGNRPSTADRLRAANQELQVKLAETQQQTAALRQALAGGTPVQQAQGVAQVTGERERASTANALDLLNGSQSAAWQSTQRSIDRDNAAVGARADAQKGVIAAEGDRALALQRGFQQGEGAARGWVTNELLPGLTQDYLARTGGTKMDFLNKAQEINSQITPRDLLGMVAPLALLLS